MWLRPRYTEIGQSGRAVQAHGRARITLPLGSSVKAPNDALSRTLDYALGEADDTDSTTTAIALLQSTNQRKVTLRKKGESYRAKFPSEIAGLQLLPRAGEEDVFIFAYLQRILILSAQESRGALAKAGQLADRLTQQLEDDGTL